MSDDPADYPQAAMLADLVDKLTAAVAHLRQQLAQVEAERDALAAERDELRAVARLAAQVADELQARLDRAQAERDALAKLATVALELGEAEDYFAYVAGRDALRKAARAYRMAEAAREWAEGEGHAGG